MPAVHPVQNPVGRASAAAGIEIHGLTASYSGHVAVADVNLSIAARRVTAMIGPSGCGKSTVLRCMNGMHLTIPGAAVEGTILLGGTDIYAGGTDLAEVRRHVGMVFQRPNPFPTMSIYENVAAGLRLGRRLGVRRGNRKSLDEVVERSLTQAGLWREVKDRLTKPGGGLSGGQQQRLCIARALAVKPRVLLMDEPCSALDPISSLVIEDLIAELKNDYTVVIVTHNMQQAARVSDTTAFFTIAGFGQPGRLVEAGPTSAIFTNPEQEATEDYITGKFG